MKFAFLVEVEVERTEGKFASRDDLAARLQDAIEGADPGSLTGENDGQYEVTSWEVHEYVEPKTKEGKPNATDPDHA